MSIINDALKKTQKNLSGKKDKEILKPGIDQTDPESQNVRDAAITPKDKLKIIIIGSLLLIIILMGVILYLILNKEIKNTPTEVDPVSSVKTISKETPSAATPAPVTPAISTQPLGKPVKVPPQATVAPVDYDKPLVLDGIMRIDNKNFALINGDDYEEGESIFGMKIILIADQHVEIQRADGKIIELNVKGK